MAASSDQLVRVLKVLQPSLVMYLADSGIWSYPGPEEIRLALAGLVGDQQAVMDRAALILEEREVPVPKKAFPISFSGWHDVDLGHILPRIVTSLEQQAVELGRVAEAPDDATAAGLAAEAVKTIRRHIDSLRHIATQQQVSPPAKPAAT
jgi:hypothetical protein